MSCENNYILHSTQTRLYIFYQQSTAVNRYICECNIINTMPVKTYCSISCKLLTEETRRNDLIFIQTVLTPRENFILPGFYAFLDSIQLDLSKKKRITENGLSYQKLLAFLWRVFIKRYTFFQKCRLIFFVISSWIF